MGASLWPLSFTAGRLMRATCAPSTECATSPPLHKQSGTTLDSFGPSMSKRTGVGGSTLSRTESSDVLCSEGIPVA
eukprot:880643-Prymnesium_polylepis.1